MKKFFAVIFLLFLAAILAAGFWLKTNYQTGKLQEKIFQTALPDFQSSSSSTSIFGNVLGMNEPRYYLVLFLNNTELRPGGGFIGSYGVVRMKDGKPEVLKIEGTEIIDNKSGVGGTPPLPLAKYLGIKKWQFRDSNWSPDFPTSAKMSLQFYRDQKGLEANNIKGVVAVTPSLFEEILTITGPIKAGSLTFNKDNFVESLQYESEYGYADRGLTFENRKTILTEFSKALLPKLLTTSFTHWNDYKRIIPKMVSEKQIMLYSEIEAEQNYILANGWGGNMKNDEGDYLLWSDANLGALKTDASISRLLTYRLDMKNSRASASMNYYHNGKFDWRTTRYLDYVRVFVPNGSKLIKVEAEKGKVSDISEGDENGFHWFGAFISIEPGKSEKLTFTYELSDEIRELLKKGDYKLRVQKQLGSKNVGLTLMLNFDKKLSTAEPSELPEKFGDREYYYSDNFETDKSFSVTY